MCLSPSPRWGFQQSRHYPLGSAICRQESKKRGRFAQRILAKDHCSTDNFPRVATDVRRFKFVDERCHAHLPPWPRGL